MDLPLRLGCPPSRALLVVFQAIIVALAVFSFGCRSVPRDPPTDPVDTTASVESIDINPDTQNDDDAEPRLSEELQPLESIGWYDDAPVPWVRTDSAGARWRNDDVDPLVAKAGAERPDLSSAQKMSNPVIAANAAIVLARWGSEASQSQLAATIRDSQMRINLRSAAIEALGEIERPSAIAELQSLVDEYAERKPVVDGRADEDDAVIYGQLIRALARHAQSDDERRFVEALSNPAWNIRLEGVLCWMQMTERPLPDAALALRVDDDPRVRGAALWVIAAHHDTRALEYLRSALDDQAPEVREAAIAALGALGSSEAKAMLVEARRAGNESVRAAAVTALARAGMNDEAELAAGDPALAVRVAVAQALERADDSSDAVDPMTIVTAEILAHDASADVEQQTIASIASWPLEQAGVVLLGVLADGRYAACIEAADQLASRWPASIDQSFEIGSTAHLAPLADLKQRWIEEHATLDAAAVLMEIERLKDSSVEARREAAARLAIRSAVVPLDSKAVEQLAEIARSERDPLVWRALLAAMASSGDQAAARLVYAALASPAADVRRGACTVLAAHPDPRHAQKLLPLLADPDVATVAAAIRALGAMGELDDPGPLVEQLKSPDEALRLEAALALFRLRAPQGVVAMRRLMDDRDERSRIAIARAMGEAADREFLPALVNMLADEPAVRHEALVSLAQVAGLDAAIGPNGSADEEEEQARWWQMWYRETRNQPQAFAEP